MGAFRTVIGYNTLQFENGSTEPNRYLILDIQTTSFCIGEL